MSPDDRIATGLRDSDSLLRRHGLSSVDVLVSMALLVVTCAYLPFFFSWAWTPRMLVILVALPPGVIVLGTQLRKRDRPALILSAFLGWCLVVSLMSDNPLLSIRGTINQESSLVTFVGAAALLALARQLSVAGRRLLAFTVLGAASLNAIVATVQVIFQIDGGDLSLLQGRAIGLTPNPIPLAAVMLMGIFVCLWLFTHGRSRRPMLLVVGLAAYAAVLAFTGTRVALISLVVVGVAVLASNRSRATLLGVGSVGAGFVMGTVIVRMVGGGGDTLSRSSAVDGSGRDQLWGNALSAIVDRPVVGWGIGRYRTAVQGRFTFDQIAQGGDNQAIPDAHNIVLGVALAVGIPGLLLLGWFVWTVAHRTTGIFVGSIVSVALMWMLQPMSLIMLLPTMLLLGAGLAEYDATSTQPSAALAQVPRTGWAISIAVGVGAAGFLAVADLRLNAAVTSFDAEAFDETEWMFPGDPIVSDLGARLWSLDAFSDDNASARTRDLLNQSIRLEPNRAYWWSRLAAFELASGQTDAAVAAARRAIELQPTAVDAWRVLDLVADETGDSNLADEVAPKLCELRLDECPQPN